VFRIKICGITRPEDALAAATAGADAIGLNFYQASPRFVDPRRIEAIRSVLPAHVAKVGVFVNAAADAICEAAKLAQLDYAQLHGDEPPDVIGQLRGLPVIRAFRLADRWQPIIEYLQHCRGLGSLPTAVLVDACRPGSYGGTGELADWSMTRQYHDLGLDLPLILAGGLRPDNVAAAIAAVRPFGVDTASGVEQSPGSKDAQKITDFVAAARNALVNLGKPTYYL